jgi:hypothetical protein
MDLLLLGPPYEYTQNPFYRGTERPSVPYAEDLPEEASINQAFRDHVREGGESGVVHDLDVACRIYQAVSAHGLSFDLVEVVRWPEKPSVGSQFLGYDVSSGLRNSLISGWSGSEPLPDPTDYAGTTIGDVSEAVEPLFALWYCHCLGLLNEHRLFADHVDALWCLVGGTALQVLQPGVLEYGNYEVVGLWLVPFQTVVRVAYGNIRSKCEGATMDGQSNSG